MSDIFEYKCPCCGGGIAFDSQAQRMKCPYCDTEFDMETLQSYDNDLKIGHEDDTQWNTDANQSWQETEDGMNVYVCNSCGGEIIGDDTLAATSCPYCGNPVIIKGKLSGEWKPDLVVPFQLDKDAAKEALTKHLTGKKLLPKVFRDENHIDEIKGVYVPFWLFSTDANAQMRFRGSKVRTWADSRYYYTETSYYSLQRSGCISYDHVPADASTKMPDDMMDSLEPFDVSKAVDFQTAYLSGYLADKYDVTAEDSKERINKRIRTTTENVFRSETCGGYSSVALENSSFQFHNRKIQYVLLPVWVLNTSWNGSNYQFCMNGQTGKFVGNLPMDKGLFWKYLLGYAAGFSAIAYVLLTVLQFL